MSRRTKNKSRKHPLKQRDWTDMVGPVLGVLVWLLLVAQAILTLVSGEWPGGPNYYGQVVDPALQLVVAGMFLVGGILYLVNRKKLQRQADIKGKPTSYRPPGSVQDRWPWQ